MMDQREPTLEELLNEPIIQQVMVRDGVRAEDVHRLMEAVRARRLRGTNRHARLLAAATHHGQPRIFGCELSSA